MDTPIYLKTKEDQWPRDPYSYMVSSKGIYTCRNTRFFRASVPARSWPRELAPHHDGLELTLPARIPQHMLETVVAFFAVIAREFGAEAMVGLSWHDERGWRVVVPDQLSVVYLNYQGKPFPSHLKYAMPELPLGEIWLGDIHSHADMFACVSRTDHVDVEHRPGIHIVVGNLLKKKEPPDIEITFTVDGWSFKIKDLEEVAEGYSRRNRGAVPDSWFDKIEIQTESSWFSQKSAAEEQWDSNHTHNVEVKDDRGDDQVEPVSTARTEAAR